MKIILESHTYSFFSFSFQYPLWEEVGFFKLLGAKEHSLDIIKSSIINTNHILHGTFTNSLLVNTSSFFLNIFPYSSCEEIHEQLENCQENGALWSWMKGMSGFHNIDNFSKLFYIVPFLYFDFLYDSLHDRIEFWLEESFNRKIPVDNNLLLLYVPDLYIHIFSFSYCLIL